MSKTFKQVNGNKNILSEDQEYMRLQVVDLELKARYWEAQWKIRFYTLEAETLKEPYDAFIVEQKKIQDEAMIRFQEQIDKMNKEAGVVPEGSAQDTVPQEAKQLIEPDEEFFRVDDNTQVPEQDPYKELKVVQDYAKS